MVVRARSRKSPKRDTAREDRREAKQDLPRVELTRKLCSKKELRPALPVSVGPRTSSPSRRSSRHAALVSPINRRWASTENISRPTGGYPCRKRHRRNTRPHQQQLLRNASSGMQSPKGGPPSFSKPKFNGGVGRHCNNLANHVRLCSVVSIPVPSSSLKSFDSLNLSPHVYVYPRGGHPAGHQTIVDSWPTCSKSSIARRLRFRSDSCSRK